ncbi:MULTISPECIES: minor capsid protein [Streptococcus]|uniref:Minor capsid protein n=1 Tax=Streptococcus pseudopneumoniae TaxID=257758 RepID=A0AAW4C8R7_9STRE|nr:MULTISPECIES: minor capsid protein [Streptococcus]MBF9674170.1 minor capsid protein [Streptococcus pseudopneumoniae]
MKNQEYWAKRKANLIYQQMDKAEKQADQFDKVYQEAKTYLDKEVNKIFDKFQRDYGLSQVDARQVLKNMKDKKNLNELRKVLEARPNDPNIQRLLADLDSPAYSFRMKRLERLSDDLDRMRESIYHSEKTGSDAFYSDLMKDSYYKATFDLQQQTGLAYGFSGLPESEIKHLQSFSWVGDGSTYSTNIWKNTGKLTSSIKDELLMSLMTGRGTRETAQAIAERFDVGQNDARRLVRTESAFFHNQMELLSYEEADIEKYIFVAVLDKRTSHICQEHDNKVYDRDKAVPGVNCPPMHPWCRSTTVAYDEDADYSKLKRRARNPETGKTELVPADMTYKEWYSKYVAKDVKNEIQDYKKSDQTVSRYNTQKLFSDVSNAWDEIGKGGLSKEQLVGLLKSEYELGNFSSDITKLIGVSSAYIDVSSLATSLVRHGQQYSLDEFMLIKEAVQKPYLILDNSERVEKSIISYVKIPNKDKVIMEAVMVPRDEMLVIHFNKVGIRQVKKNGKNMLTLYKKEK